MKFFHVKITPEFVQTFEDLPPGERNGAKASFLTLFSTEWSDLADARGGSGLHSTCLAC